MHIEEQTTKITKDENASEADSIVEPEMEITNKDSTIDVTAPTQGSSN